MSLSNAEAQAETLDALARGSIALHQSKAGYRVNVDAVLLADFADVKPGMRVLDLGCGDGAVVFLLAKRFPKARCFVGIDQRAEAIARAHKNALLNAALGEDLFEFRLQDWNKALPKGLVFDVVVSNPPWFEEGRGRVNPNRERAASRHAQKGALHTWARAAKRALRPGGTLYVVFRAERFIDLVHALRKERLEPKVLRVVHDSIAAPAKSVLLAAKRDGKKGLQLREPLILKG